MFPPMNHHKAHAGSHDVDYFQPPLPVTAGTSFVDSPSRLDPRGFANPDASANAGNWASLTSDGPSLAITLLPSSPCSTQIMSSAQDRSSMQAPGSALAMSTASTTCSFPERRQYQSALSAISGGVDRADEDFDELVRQLWDEHLMGLDALTAA